MARRPGSKDGGKSDGYEVGYGRPPRHRQFQPGHSGNRRGRPKGTKNLKTDLVEELSEQILVREGDRARKVSKQRAVIKSLMSRTLKGDARAASLLLSMMMRFLDTGENADQLDLPLQDDELEILQTFEHRLQRADQDTAAVNAGDNETERS